MKRSTLIRATVTLSLVGLLFIVPLSQAKDAQTAQKNKVLINQVLHAPGQATTLHSALHSLLAIFKHGSWSAQFGTPERGKNPQNPPAQDGGDNGCIKLENPGSQYHAPGSERPFKHERHDY